MADRNSSIHVAMFPWFAFGHFIPYLHLANKLAESGHRVSFLLPKGVQPKLNQRNQHPHLIHFFPLVLPHVDGLPSGAETCSDIPFSLQNNLCTALDLTKEQVKSILGDIKPDFVFYDFACWLPSLGRELGFKSVFYSVLFACGQCLGVVPFRKIVKGMTVEELMQVPPGYPSSKVRLRADEVSHIQFYADEFGSGLSFYERILKSKQESDVYAIRTCREIEGPFIGYIAQMFSKPILLTGPVLDEKPITKLEEKWDKWLNNFAPDSVVYCSFGSQVVLQKDQFQELVLGLEVCRSPFLAALTPPSGCLTIEEALPEGFEERVKGRGCVYGGWVQQTQILDHPSVGCFVSHCGSGSLWESLLSNCQIVLIPQMCDQILYARQMVEELKVAVEVKREETGWISKEKLSNAILSLMDKGSAFGTEVKKNHAKLKQILANKDTQETYVDEFINSM